MMAAPRLVALGAITSCFSGGTPNRANPLYWAGTIPWISAATLKSSHVHESDQHITAAGVKAGSKLAPVGATLVLVRGMALHRETRIGIATRPVSFNQDVKALVPKNGVVPEFLLYSLQARSAQILELVSSAGSGTGVLNTQLLQRLPVWLPDEQVQRRIVAMIDSADQCVSALARLIAKKRAIYQGIMQQLLNGTTRLPGFTDPWRETVLGENVSYVKTVALSRAELDHESPVRYLHYGDIHTRTSVRLDAAREPMPRASSSLLRNAGRTPGW